MYFECYSTTAFVHIMKSQHRLMLFWTPVTFHNVDKSSCNIQNGQITFYGPRGEKKRRRFTKKYLFFLQKKESGTGLE